MQRSPSLRVEFALLVLLALLWGGSFTLIKVAVETIPPATLTAARVAIAAALLLGVMRWRGIALPRGPLIWGHLFVQSVINLSLPFLLISWGEQHVSSGLASILTTTAPFFAFAIAAATGHAARGPSQALGLACGFAGVIAIVGPGILSELGGPQLMAQLALVGAGLCYGSSSNYGRLFKGLSPIAVGAGTLIWASLLTVPLSVVWDRPWRLQPSTASLAALTLLSVLSTALAFSIYFRLLGTLGTVATSTVGYLRVGFGVLLGIMFLGERMTVPAAIGLASIVLGVAAINNQLGRIGGWLRRAATPEARS
jgi:drug/metabolite transporter (DMT)-like permease